ncbi:alginate lyase [Flavobacteriaceae bacterium MAR_2010_72]|nr:alginate lyase [Flavobacteriaceae bacterium MAR_2010_72]TVZ58656.1 alginate lyase [Flavobacteriaceae bacterium MAR_2010_105]
MNSIESFQIFLKKGMYLVLLFCVVIFGCSSSDDTTPDTEPEIIDVIDDNPEPIVPNPPPALLYANIDFSNWKVTLPVDLNNNGSPDEYLPAQLINNGYRTLDPVKPYMYDDTTDGSIVFYTFPDVSTTNSSYSRTELRELINPNNSKVNWSLNTGGKMTGRLKVASISQDTQSSSTYHNVIVMQIHGIISQADMSTYGFSSNNGPPLLKMYWKDGYLWAHKKSLVNESTSGTDLLNVSSATWTDIKHNFGYVGFEPFNFTITASTGKLELQLNNNTPYIYQDVSLTKWPFENYFKAGNYLVSTNANAFAYVKYYSLTITH